MDPRQSAGAWVAVSSSHTPMVGGGGGVELVPGLHRVRVAWSIPPVTKPSLILNIVSYKYDLFLKASALLEKSFGGFRCM